MKVTTQYLQSGQAITDLRAINARFIHNFVTNDIVAHGLLLHETFVAIQRDGSVLDRATYLDQWATGFSAEAIPYWETRGEVIRIVGDVGLVRSTNVFVVRRDGEEHELASTYTDTYVFTDGRWLCLQAQLTSTEPPHVPAAATVVSIYRDGVKQTV